MVMYTGMGTVGPSPHGLLRDLGDQLTNTFKKDFLCLGNEHILGGDQGCIPEIMDEILTTARALELEVNADDIEELIMGHEDELTTEELQEILNEEHQETQRNVSPFEQEENDRRPMPTSAIKDLLKKVGECQSNGTQTKLMSVGLGIFTTTMLLITSGKSRKRSPERINRFHIEVYGESMIG
ncbi:hypothetical protein TNCV_2071631 [Trichonephila clavipes]|uniref:Uncharacterized protein n=1 Tax=Trichonephila clavipes TaxID=2585209 RepID=A0A8X6W3C4_TRICX|nr:hypothetical protein TNCV_2071631 [Trichonephila clavipes]